MKIAVLGGGSWGTALALVGAGAGHSVTIHARDAATVGAINTGHENAKRLPGFALPETITAGSDLAAAVAGAGAIVSAVPAQATRDVLAALAPAPGVPVVLAAKGLERATGLTMSAVAADVLPGAPVAVLSGPGFAADVAAGLPTAVTIAALDVALADDLCAVFAGPAFRPYAETDVTGVEIGGAVKNVLAIAAGIVTGRNLGASAQAALIARGFAELRRLAVALGAEGETLMGLSGLGDLVLTCTSGQSRNFAYGERLGGGETAAEGVLVEGAATAAAAARLAAEHHVDMPVVAAVAAVIDGMLTVDGAIDGLLARPLKRERA